MRASRTLAAAIVLSMMPWIAGCQFAPKSSSSVWPWQKPSAPVLPDRVLPVWTDSVLHQPNQPGIRGFGGRIYFYAKENTDPLEVDGSLAVYVFDADDSSPSDQKPLRKFVFTADQFKTHMSKTTIGPSYSVWLPWGEVGGPPQRLSIIARFEGRQGGTIISDPTIKMLPGVPTNNNDITKGKPKPTQPSDAQISLAGHVDDSPRLKKKNDADEDSDVKTIDLPPAFQRHLRSLNAQPDANSSPSTESPSNDSPKSSAYHPKAPKDSDGSSELADADREIVSPMSTRVYDYRSRGKYGGTSPSSRLTKADIREGRWIKSIERDNQRN